MDLIVCVRDKMEKTIFSNKKFANNNADKLFDVIETRVETLVTDMKYKVFNLEKTIEILMFELERKDLELKSKRDQIKNLIQVIESQKQKIYMLESDLEENGKPAYQHKQLTENAEKSKYEILKIENIAKSTEKNCANTRDDIEAVTVKQQKLDKELKKVNAIVENIGPVKGLTDLRKLCKIDHKLELICQMIDMLQNSTWLVQNATRGKMIMKAI